MAKLPLAEGQALHATAAPERRSDRGPVHVRELLPGILGRLLLRRLRYRAAEVAEARTDTGMSTGGRAA